jgi:hypothetical protein
MGRIVIVAYKPLPGKKQELIKLVLDHHKILKDQNLVTGRKPVIMKALTGELIEVFEWKSSEAIHEAHSNPEVHKLWSRFSAVCTYESPINIKEFNGPFSEFESID